jgi:hypothetical protein
MEAVCTDIITELSGHTVAYADKGQSEGRCGGAP